MKKLIVVTGGTRGIGKAVCFKFAETGQFDIATCSSNIKNINLFKEEFAHEFPDANLYIWQSDLSKKEEINIFANNILKLKKDINVLVNNTGIFLPGSILEEEDGVFEKQFFTNVSSAYHLTRILAKAMKDKNSGSIFNICSTASIMAYPNGGSYCISKFALYGFTKVLREELKPFGVKVTAVLPGATLTDSWEGVNLPENRFIPPEDIAETIYSAYLISGRSIIEEILIRPQLGDI